MKYDKRTYNHLAKKGTSSRRAYSSHGQAEKSKNRSYNDDDLQKAFKKDRSVFEESCSPERKFARREKMIRENVKRHKKKHKKNYILYYILMLIIVLVVGISLSFTVFFNIEKITVEGNGSIPADMIISSSGVKTGQNLLRISTAQAENKIITKYVTIDKAIITRKLPSVLSIKLVPSEIMAVVRNGDKFYTLSNGGRIIKISDKNTNNSVMEVIGCDLSNPCLGDYLNTNTKNKLDILNLLNNAIKQNDMTNKIQYADLSDISTIKLYYEKRIEIKLGGISDASYELSHVKQMIQKEISKKEIVSIDASLKNGKYYILPLQSLNIPNKKTAVSRNISNEVSDDVSSEKDTNTSSETSSERASSSKP